jgi:hypothetical protein
VGSTVTLAVSAASAPASGQAATPLAGPRLQLGIRIAPAALSAPAGTAPLGDGRLSVSLAPSTAPQAVVSGAALAAEEPARVAIESATPRYQTGPRAIILPEDS